MVAPETGLAFFQQQSWLSEMHAYGKRNPPDGFQLHLFTYAFVSTSVQCQAWCSPLHVHICSLHCIAFRCSVRKCVSKWHEQPNFFHCSCLPSQQFYLGFCNDFIFGVKCEFEAKVEAGKILQWIEWFTQLLSARTTCGRHVKDKDDIHTGYKSGSSGQDYLFVRRPGPTGSACRSTDPVVVMSFACIIATSTRYEIHFTAVLRCVLAACT